jgi:hypothetical protein
MMNHGRRFNRYLLVALTVGSALTWGCRTPQGKREAALTGLQVFVEVNADAAKRSRPVQIYRENPFTLNVETEPFLTQANVSEARVVEAIGGFAIRIQLDRQGSWLLEQKSLANRGKRLAFMTQFPAPQDPKVHVNRWLAAPIISGRMSDGILIFTPDATRDEAYQIVLGLNNAARKNDNTPDSKTPK